MDRKGCSKNNSFVFETGIFSGKYDRKHSDLDSHFGYLSEEFRKSSDLHRPAVEETIAVAVVLFFSTEERFKQRKSHVALSEQAGG